MLDHVKDTCDLTAEATVDVMAFCERTTPLGTPARSQMVTRISLLAEENLSFRWCTSKAPSMLDLWPGQDSAVPLPVLPFPVESDPSSSPLGFPLS